MSIFKKKLNIEKLEKRGDIGSLSEVLEHEDYEIRFKAIAALGKLKALEPLMDALSDDRGENRSIAAYYLGQIEINNMESPSVALLIKCLKDGYSTARHNAAKALYLIGNNSALEDLKVAYIKETDSEAKSSMSKAIQRFQL